MLLAESGQFSQRWLAWFYERGWFRKFSVLLQDQMWATHMHARRTFHRYDALSTEMLATWHQRYYQRDNMAVIVVGKVDLAEVEQLVERYFVGQTDDAREALQHPEPTACETVTAIRTRLGTPFWNQSVVAVGAWNRGAMRGEKAACEVIQEHLRHRAFDYLRLQHCLAYQTTSFFDGRQNGGSLLLAARVKRGDEGQAEELLKRILSQSLEVDMSEKELNGLRNKLLAKYAHMNANPGWYARELTLGAFGEYAVDMEDYPTQLRETKPSHIREVLTRLATERGRIVVRQVPLMSVAATVGAVAGTFAAIVCLVVWVLIR